MARYLLFDFDGTLYDTGEGITKSVQYALQRFGVSAEREELRCFVGPPLADMFAEKFGFDRARTEEAVLAFRERYNPIGVYESEVYAGMPAFLARMRERGYVLAVATSKPQPLAEELLERSGMRQFFSVVVGSRTDGNNNSKREVVERVIAALGAEKSACVLIGDTKYDVAGAHAAGIGCIAVRYGYAAPGELEQAGADAIADDLDELEKMLTCGEKTV